jgi:ABC-2 type transport system ATP-binding protein
LLRPSAGAVTILGEPAWSLSAAGKERLGYLPQEVSVYPWMRVSQLIEFTAAFYPRWNGRLAQRLLGEFELDSKARVAPLSVGQLQKLAIVLALGHEPDMLILDEPVASLDPGARRQFLKTVLDLAGAGRTCLFSSHITSDLERVADRVAILKEGRIVYEGEMDALKDQVKRLHVEAAAPLPNGSFQVPGMLHCSVFGNRAHVSVSGFTPELPAQIARQWAASVEVQDLNLEEIFLEMHHG